MLAIISLFEIKDINYDIALPENKLYNISDLSSIHLTNRKKSVCIIVTYYHEIPP